MELPGERDNTWNNARCTLARKTTHSLDGQHQDVDRTPCGRNSQNDRTEIDGESTSMSSPTSDRKRLKNRKKEQFPKQHYFRLALNIVHLVTLSSYCSILSFV